MRQPPRPYVPMIPPTVAPDLLEFARSLGAAGITITLPNAGPEDPLPEPLRAATSLSDAVIEERWE